MPHDNYTINENGCWEWDGCVTSTGYSRIWDKSLKKPDWGHRVYYRLFVGDIPKGLHIDHLCENRICVNPDHLEAVTNRENVIRGNSEAGYNARKTHCIRGHEYNKENTYFYKRHNVGIQRCCKICQIDRKKRIRQNQQ